MQKTPLKSASIDLHSSILWRIVSVIICTFAASFSFASSNLTIKSDNTTIYTGPSTKYRPLTILGDGTVLPVSPKIISTEEGEFYKVLIKGRNKRQRSVGYIPVTASVLLEQSDQGENIDKYKSLKLAQSSFQASVSYLKQETYVWQAGYLKYPAPGFYLKGFGGQIFNNTDSSFLLGIESGNDSFIYQNYSGYAALGIGAVLGGGEDTPFAGAGDALPFFLSGNVGARYNAAEHASVSLGLGGVSIFNKSNSFVSLSIVMTFEVGL